MGKEGTGHKGTENQEGVNVRLDFSNKAGNLKKKVTL